MTPSALDTNTSIGKHCQCAANAGRSQPPSARAERVAVCVDEIIARRERTPLATVAQLHADLAVLANAGCCPGCGWPRTGQRGTDR